MKRVIAVTFAIALLAGGCKSSSNKTNQAKYDINNEPAGAEATYQNDPNAPEDQNQNQGAVSSDQNKAPANPFGEHLPEPNNGGFGPYEVNVP